MSDLTPAALLVLGRQFNTISTRQLDDSGVTRHHREQLVRGGVLEHVGQSVLRVVGAPVTLEARLAALCLQHPRGFVTGPTAGGLLGLRRMPKVARIHFSLPHGSRADVPGHVLLRQTTRWFDEHRRDLGNGIVVADWVRLAFDLSSGLRDRDLASVIEQMLHRGVCTEEQLGAMARLMCAPRRPGSARFARVLLRRHPGRFAESHPELQVLEGLLALGVPVEPQVGDLVLPDGGSVRIDMAVPQARWAVEVDVHPAHLDLVGTTRDKRRDRQLHLIGWQVERVTELDLLDLRGTLRELEALYRARVAQVA
jgi:hypothetical protein